MITSIMLITQMFFTIITGLYFLTQLRGQKEDKSGINEDSRHIMERLNFMRRISLTKPLTEETRPSSLDEIIGQENGVEALKIALCGKIHSMFLSTGLPVSEKPPHRELQWNLQKIRRAHPSKGMQNLLKLMQP